MKIAILNFFEIRKNHATSLVCFEINACARAFSGHQKSLKSFWVFSGEFPVKFWCHSTKNLRTGCVLVHKKYQEAGPQVGMLQVQTPSAGPHQTYQAFRTWRRQEQCGNFRIFLWRFQDFLSLRFFVKSIFEDLEAVKLQFLQFHGLLILLIW